LLEPEEIPIDDVYCDDFGVRRVQPAACGGARNATSSCLSNVASRTDEIPQAMVVSVSNARRGIHGSIITTTMRCANLNNPSKKSVALFTRGGDNPRRKMQNVVALSTADDARANSGTFVAVSKPISVPNDEGRITTGRRPDDVPDC
jgi:hypothetical protein